MGLQSLFALPSGAARGGLLSSCMYVLDAAALGHTSVQELSVHFTTLYDAVYFTII